VEQLAASLLLWIAAHSTMAVTHLSPPPVVLLSPEQMTALYYKQTSVQSRAPKVDARIQGYFDWSGDAPGIIYLVHPQDTPGAGTYIDPTDNPLFRERLLHELVHFAQHATGTYAHFDCPAQGEFDAYRLGGIYLRQLGVADPMPGRMFLMRRYSAC
jgi:hypothetical protein